MSPDRQDYYRLVEHYERCLDRHGDTHRGVDWPNQEDASRRYDVMLDLVRPGTAGATLLDFGCGAGHLLEHMSRTGRKIAEYSGLDLGRRYVELCRRKFPDTDFLHVDILDTPSAVPEFDYVVLNGVLTEKRELSFEAMWDYTQRLLSVVFSKARIGMAFNVMSTQVDWQRDDLFHLPMDDVAAFLRRDVSRHFVIRHDYGLYEYCVYAYKAPPPSDGGRGADAVGHDA